MMVCAKLGWIVNIFGWGGLDPFMLLDGYLCIGILDLVVEFMQMLTDFELASTTFECHILFLFIYSVTIVNRVLPVKA